MKIKLNVYHAQVNIISITKNVIYVKKVAYSVLKIIFAQFVIKDMFLIPKKENAWNAKLKDVLNALSEIYTTAHNAFTAFNMILNKDTKINNKDQFVLYVDKVIQLDAKLVKIQKVVSNVLRVTLYKITNVK